MQKGISDRKSKEEKLEKVCSFLFEPVNKKSWVYFCINAAGMGRKKRRLWHAQHKKEADDDDYGFSLFEKVNGRFFDETI